MKLFRLLFLTHNCSFDTNNSYLTLRHQRQSFAVLSFLISSVLSLSSCTKMDSINPKGVIQTTVLEAADLLNLDTFEGTTFAPFWWGAQIWIKSGGYVSTEQHRLGKQSMRISWKPSQMDGTNTMLHAELLTRALPEGENERWYGYSSYFPSSSMSNDDQVAIVSQWHGSPDPGSPDTVPPLCIEIQSNHLHLAYTASSKPIIKPMQSPTSGKQVDLGAVKFDQWNDYVVHVKWAPDGNTGQLQVWQNGELIMDEQNINIGYPDINKPYWKVGLYCWMGKDTYPEKVVYLDEVRIGGPKASYDDVKPGRSDGTAKAWIPMSK